MVSLPLVQGVSAIMLCSSGMLANEISNGRRKKKQTVNGEEGESEAIDYHARLYIKLSTPVPSVAETDTQKSDFLVTTDAVQNTDATYGAAPLSFEIDGCQ